MNKCYLGDWFVLFQLSKNVNMYFFRAFVKDLKHQFNNKKQPTYIEKDTLPADNGGGSLVLEKKLDSDDNDSDEEEKLMDKSSSLLSITKKGSTIV